MKSYYKNPIRCLPARVLSLALLTVVCVYPHITEATPYASNLTNNTGTISFILNESADDVVLKFGTNSLDLGPLAAGSFTTNAGATSPFQVKVTKSAGNGYKTPVGTTAPNLATAGKIQISSDPVLSRFPTPRGVAVNKNPASPNFGHIYIANSTPNSIAGRSVGRGLYTLNADFSDSSNAYGDTAQTGGIAFAVSANSPYRITVGADDNVYISDYSDAVGDVYRIDGNLVTGETVLATPGGPATPTGQNHGSVLKVIAEGSTTSNNLTLYTIDEDYGSVLNNDLWRYDLGSGPMNNTTLPTDASSVLLGGASVNDDFCKGGTNNYVYLMQNRSTVANAPVIYVLDVTTLPATPVTDTRTLWRAFTGNPAASDTLTNLQSIAISPDGNYLAAITQTTSSGGALANSDTVIIPLTNGIPDMSRLMVLDTGAVTQGRGVDFDAAGNLYTVSSGDAVVRAFSPGGTATTTTGSDGTFTITLPPTTVSITNNVSTVIEGSATGAFVVNRTGDISGALTVNYTVTGTATSGTDYAALSGSVTFAPGAASTNLFITSADDSVVEPTETVILSINASTNYSVGTPSSTTISILDNETPELSLSVTQPILLESFSGGKATFQITRKGLLSSPLTANINYSGTAALGTRYNGPSTVSIASNSDSATFSLTPINNTVNDGAQSIICSLGTGTGYNLGTNISANATVIDDDFPAATVLFSDNFDTDSSGNWNVNFSDSGNDSHAIFAYDYSADGIPPAPSTPNNTTLGLKFRANELASNVVEIAASPMSQNFTGDYRVRYDMWMNYNGPLATGGAGSTQSLLSGIGTTGDHPQIPNGGSTDGGWFSLTGDGGNAAGIGDYNAYAGPTLFPDASGVYVAGMTNGPRDNFTAYYAPWGAVSAPAAQLTIYTNQTGVTPVGSFGMSWHTVAITKVGEVVTWAIDGRPLATITNDTTSFTTTGNIFVGYMDPFTSVANNTNAIFGLIDNLRVETVITPAGVTTIQVVDGALQINFTGSTSDSPGSFTVLGSGTLSSSSAAYTPEAGANIVQLAPGSFQATVPFNGATHFYRIKR